MEKLHFSIVINKPKEKVWDVMIGEDTYPLWTDVFMPGSHFLGDWSRGSKILFLAPDELGRMSGMVSQIKEVRQYEFISLETVGVVYNGEEDTSGSEARKWAGSLENYTFMDMAGKTELRVDLYSDVVNQEMIDMSQKIWPRALDKLKELVEKS